jgi:hypothetical protein
VTTILHNPVLTFISFGHQKDEIIKMYDGVVNPIEIDRLYNETINNDDRYIEIFNKHAIYNIK